MGIGTNTDLQSILNQAMSQLGSLSVSSGSTTGSSSSSSYINSVWGLAQEGQTAINGGETEKAQAIVKMVQNLLGMLSSLGTNESSKANKEVNKNNKAASDVENGAKEVATKTKADIEKLAGDIASNTSNISSALSEIEKLSGNQEDLETIQKAVEKQIEIIEENLKILNDTSSTPEAKQNALGEIKQCNSDIASLVNEITFLSKENQDAIQEQNKIVEASTNNIASLIEKSVSTISNGTVDLQSYIQTAGQQIVTNTTSSTTGASNEIIGAKATAIGSMPFNFAGAKFIQIGADQTSAGGTRIAGATKNISTLTKAIGTMGSDITNIIGSTENIQGVGAGATELVGQYQTKLNSIITATGSWSQIVEANNELTEAISTYEGSLEETSKGNEKEQNNKKLEFDTQKFRKAFGI